MMINLIWFITDVHDAMCSAFWNFFETNLQEHPRSDSYSQIDIRNPNVPMQHFSFSVTVLNILLASFNSTP